jgi:hypothetical protein
MDEKLRQILDDFTMALHGYEEEGGELPDDVEDLWADLTNLLMKEE